MNLKNMKIGNRLILGITLILLLVAAMGGVALYQASRLWQSTDDIYNHPLQVARAVRDIKIDVLLIHRSIKDYTMAETKELADAELINISRAETEIDKNILVIRNQYLGDQNDVDSVVMAFKDWQAVYNETRRIALSDNKIEAYNRTRPTGIGGKHVNKLLTEIDELSHFAKNKATQLYQSAESDKNKMYLLIIILSGLILVISFIIGYILILSVRSPLKELTQVTEKFEKGDFNARSEYISTNEIGTLAKTFNMMATSVQTELTIQADVAEISQILMKENELRPFCKTTIAFLLSKIDSQVGAVYLLDESKMNFEHFVSIGMDQKNMKSFSIETTEGQFGSVVFEKKIQRIPNIPSESIFSLPSILGTINPREIISIPIIDSNEVIAIISLASVKGFSKSAARLFEEIMITLTARFNGVISFQKTKDFAEKLNSQNSLLEAQSEELQAQSEELRVTSEELQEQNVKLSSKSIEVAEANRLKSEFLSNMSHELRTPLNSIMALSNVLIQRSKTKLSDEENSYLEIIERNGRNLLRLINDVLDLSKIEAGKIELSVKFINISMLLNNIQENIKPLADKKGLKITLEVPYDLPAIETDETRFQQVITNIIGNAVKFTEKGEVSITAGYDDFSIWIEVKDTGIGIPKKELSHIFDKFRQVDGSSSRSYEGTGLGLSIVHELVSIIGGDIQVESKLGEGSVFKLILPVKWKGDLKNYTLNNSYSALLTPDKKTILVVDDDPTAVKEISTYLQESGFNTVGTTNAAEVVELAEKYRPFAITLDVIMPEIDGWEILQRLKRNEKTQNVNVIIVSVSSDKETGLALGAIAHITKPVDRDKLLNEIRRLHANALNIMVVDDNEIDLELISEVLHKQGMKIKKAGSGSQCIELMTDNIPDVLVLDLMMPDIDGFQVLDFIRNNPKTKSLPVVIVTAKDLTHEDKEFLSGKASSILQKSGTKTNDVLKEIKRIINELESKFVSPTQSDRNAKKNILIVEDNEEAIIQIKNVLENEGYEVDIAIGGEQAIEHVKTKIPDGIILDLMMPGVDGFDVLESMRSRPETSQIPVLILTAKDLSQADLGRLSANNVYQLVQKGSIDIDNLLSKIRSMTGKTSGVVMETFMDRKATTQKTVKTKEGKYNVLIIEDNPDNMTTIKAILNNEYSITEAVDGGMGLKLAISEKPDFILLDLSLPKMNGMEVFRQIRQNETICNIPVIAVTAKAMKEDKDEILKAGFDGYVSKPIDADDLLDKIKGLFYNEE
jgi:CheY-like chemotaxis protein/signal transduction histidine kinase/CHASE3 domain sensor protein